ncbi:MAG: AAA family ATPase [Candidatus Poseidoniaceae archaeon]|nr:AAA family ATPase [Candidatus Poseidoniaceae archaeon]
MSSWLSAKAPLFFKELLLPEAVRTNIARTSLQANPPHLLLSGPSGSGKTATWRLMARQVLGSTWKARTHILQARDLSRSAGAMAKFEEFLRPEGSGSEDTLAGRTSLDAFDHTFSSTAADTPPPAGAECNHTAGQRAAVSRLIVIEDADYLGTIRQSYLRRMMEVSSGSARFIFTAHTPSRIIEALRSRTQHIRLPKIDRSLIEERLMQIVHEEKLSPVRGIVGDIAHVSSGNVRKAIFMMELLAHRNLLDDRKNLQNLLAATSLREVQHILEEALRNRVHDWRWEKEGNKNRRVLKGAMGVLDQVMSEHNLEPEDIVEQLHLLLTEGRLHLPEDMLSEILVALSACDVALHRSMQGRIELERFLFQVSDIGKRMNAAKAS